MFSSNEIRLPSSFSVIHVSVNIKSSVQKDTTLLLFFLSKTPGGYAIFGLPYLLSSFILVCLWCERTVGRSGGVRSPNFLGWVDLLSYGAPHSRAWTSLWSSKKATKMVTLKPNWLASIRKHNANGVWISHQKRSYFSVHDRLCSKPLHLTT